MSQSKYSTEYIGWKSWDSNGFGTLSDRQRNYFSVELSRCGVDLSSKANVLEIGFGNGSFLRFCHDVGWDVTGLEVNSNLVEAGKNAGYNVTFADKISSLSDNKFDIVVAFDVLEHLVSSEIENLFYAIKKVLRPGGIFIARFPNGDSPLGMRYQNGDPTHSSAIGSEMARYFSAISGLSVSGIYPESVCLSFQFPALMLRNLMLKPIFVGIDILLQFMFHPRRRVFYCSSNLVLCARNV